MLNIFEEGDVWRVLDSGCALYQKRSCTVKSGTKRMRYAINNEGWLVHQPAFILYGGERGIRTLGEV